MVGLVGYNSDTTTNGQFARDSHHQVRANPFLGSKGGDRRKVAGIKLRWCPPGRFRMGSPPDEPERPIPMDPKQRRVAMVFASSLATCLTRVS
jgi:hypothetical protein